MDFAKILDTLVKYPMAIFIVISFALGYAYWEQSKNQLKLVGEVGGLRSEISKMNEIIRLKVELAEKGCK